jgi:hypothetical protein
MLTLDIAMLIRNTLTEQNKHGIFFKEAQQTNISKYYNMKYIRLHFKIEPASRGTTIILKIKLIFCNKEKYS